MAKKHFKPEFQVIRHNAANAKFYVTSSDPFTSGGTPSGGQEGDASKYDAGSNFSLF